MVARLDAIPLEGQSVEDVAAAVVASFLEFGVEMKRFDSKKSKEAGARMRLLGLDEVAARYHSCIATSVFFESHDEGHDSCPPRTDACPPGPISLLVLDAVGKYSGAFFASTTPQQAY